MSKRTLKRFFALTITLITVTAAAVIPASAATFSDVDANSDLGKAVSLLVDKGIITGMKDYCWALGLDLRRLQDALTKNSGVTPEVFAFPFGDVDNEAVPVLKSLGIVAAFSCEDKIDRLTGDPKELFHLGRINRPSGISTEEFMFFLLRIEKTFRRENGIWLRIRKRRWLRQ